MPECKAVIRDLSISAVCKTAFMGSYWQTSYETYQVSLVCNKTVLSPIGWELQGV